MTDETLSAAELRRELGLSPPGADREQPPKAKPVQRELALQMASFEWLQALEWIGQKPVFSHPANERTSIRGSVLAHRAGQRAGTPDWLFWLPEGRTLSVELKAGASLSPAQRAFRDEIQALGHPWHLCRSIEEMAEAMKGSQLDFRETAKARAIREWVA